MLKIMHLGTYGWETAIRGMRNPLNSWDKSDSAYCRGASALCDYCDINPGEDTPCFASSERGNRYILGKNDLALAKSLIRAGNDHSKFLRMIGISMDITSNQVWWAEFDTYKVGTARNSCSKMHTIHIKSFEPDDFSHEGIDAVGGSTKECFLNTLKELERLRILYNRTKDRIYWRAIIELLPSGYNLRATVTLNYAVARNQYHARKAHKLDEWHTYCAALERLPYAELIRMEGKV
nr:MAG TPA: hypothetical protein [Caudoviricetes sp.]